LKIDELKNLTPRPPLRCGEGESEVGFGAGFPLSTMERGIKGVRLN